jgi:hypothetical protein
MCDWKKKPRLADRGPKRVQRFNLAVLIVLREHSMSTAAVRMGSWTAASGFLQISSLDFPKDQMWPSAKFCLS